MRLENAETLIEKGLGPKSTLSDYFFGNTNEGNHKSETPVETAERVKQRNPTSKRYSPADHRVSKSGKPKLRKTNQNCLGRKYSKMNDLVKKVTESVDLGKINDISQSNTGPHLTLDKWLWITVTPLHQAHVTRSAHLQGI